MNLNDILFTNDIINNNLSSLNDNKNMKQKKIDIFNQKRNKKKSLTIVQNLLTDDLKIKPKKILKMLRKRLNCNGYITDDKKYGNILALQGDHRIDVKKFIIDVLEYNDDDVIIHG